MKSFLEYVADDLIGKYGNNLSHVAVVFPNKRASLFLNSHLAKLSEQPLWSPAYITISDLFRKYSSRTVADPIKLVCDLHKCFIEQTGIDETLDHFYGWGQLLLADFDDLDKNMADADKVFANVRDIHEFDDTSFLSEEQKEAIRRFFSNFSDDHNTELKQRFLRLWSKMGNIYHAFNERLKQQNLAYEGALYREVVENMESLNFQFSHYAFVGFNMLQQVEQRLFNLFQREGRAHFYWDFDHYYMKSENEAGHYIAQYLADFPNELDTDLSNIYRQFSEPKDICFISASTENAQARYISHWLQQKQRIASGRRTAIVLCNESLLQSVVHCLPDEVQKVNITTGYPLVQTPVASLVKLLLTLQASGYSMQRERFRLRQVSAVLRHPYAPYISPNCVELLQQLNKEKNFYPTRHQLAIDENCEHLFTPTAENLQMLSWLCEVVQRVAKEGREEHDPLFQESVFRMYTLLNRLHSLVESGDLVVDTTTLQGVLAQLVASTTVPFHGEPAEGIQVMGVLETRNLDFDHVLLLSCNEGNMPKGVNDTSFIPYSIRKAYGLTTIDHKVSIYSYYFHRLLQRASDITIAYNNATTDGQTGEMSRFMLQLMVESGHHISFQTLQTQQSIMHFHPNPVTKTAAVMEQLRNKFQKKDDTCQPLLTPTAINRYLRCQLQFYYNYVCGLKQPDKNEDDTIDNRIFGNIFHESARIIYQQLMQSGNDITAATLTKLLKEKILIERAVDEAFTKELFMVHDPRYRMELNGMQLINREVIIHYVKQLLDIDRKLTPFSVIGIECDVMAPLKTRHLTTTIGGRIDRLDCVDGHIRVIDYKTGSSRLKPLPDIEAVFSTEAPNNHGDYYLQAMLYALLVSSSTHFNATHLPVSPALLFIQHTNADNYSPVLLFGKERIDDVTRYGERFYELLVQTIDEIFEPGTQFLPTTDLQRCKNCPYRLLCTQH